MFIALGVITVDYYGMRRPKPDRVFDRLVVPEKPRLQTPKLYQQTQQRGDDFFARENQNVTQRHQPRRDATSQQLADLCSLA